MRRINIPSIYIALSICCATSALAMDDRTDLLDIEPQNFSRSTIIDNKWMPLKPGKQHTFEGTTVDEDGKRVPHRIIYTVTDLVKTINGIDAVVVWDQDIAEGRLDETELVFFAQDNAGNVWHLGQILERYDETQLIGGQAWLVGHLKGAKAGIMMPANPKEGTPSYSQGFAPPPYNWTDRGQVRKMGEKITVPAGAFDNVMIVEERAKDEAAGALQLKYHAAGIGTIKVSFEGDDHKKELLELVKIADLSPQEMDEARAEALKIEDRGYVYGSTPRAQRRER